MKRIISISICMVFLLSASTILLAQDSDMTFCEFKQKVKRIIKERNAYLFVHFKDKEYGKMPGKLAKYETKLVTHKGKVISGKEALNLKKYWEKVAKDGGTDLNFEDPHLVFMELEVGPAPGNEKEINYVALEITKFSFKVGKKTYEGWIDPIYKHKVECIIFED
jgi:hypothetical protein